MSLIRKAFVLLTAALCVSALSQTKISLKSEGGIFAGPRLRILQQRLILGDQASAGRTALGLSSELINAIVSLGTRLTAIVVPPAQTDVSTPPDHPNMQYVIGLLYGNAGVPQDMRVVNPDFDKLRQYLRDPRLAQIDTEYAQIQTFVEQGDLKQVASIAGQLKHDIDADAPPSDPNYFTTKYYAGYLLADLDRTEAFKYFADVVDAYRGQVERALNLAIRVPNFVTDAKGISPIGVLQTTGANGYSFGELKADLIASRIVPNRAAVPSVGLPSQSLSIYKIWHGRSLFIASDKPGSPYNKNDNISFAKYLEKNYSMDDKTILRNITDLTKF